MSRWGVLRSTSEQSLSHTRPQEKGPPVTQATFATLKADLKRRLPEDPPLTAQPELALRKVPAFPQKQCANRRIRFSPPLEQRFPVIYKQYRFEESHLRHKVCRYR